MLDLVPLSSTAAMLWVTLDDDVTPDVSRARLLGEEERKGWTSRTW